MKKSVGQGTRRESRITGKKMALFFFPMISGEEVRSFRNVFKRKVLPLP